MNLSDKEDVEELKEVMSVLSTEIPKLLEAISKTMYNADNAAKLGEQTAEFYKKLKEAGMTDQQAFELTEQYMSNFSIGKMIGGMIGGSGHHHDHDEDDISKAVRERIKKKISEANGDDD